MKTFFDGIFIDKEKLKAEDIEYSIKLEYYKTVKEKENVGAKYGIEIVKTEYKKDKIEVDSEKIDEITSDVNEVDKILNVLRNNEVTPVAMRDVLNDMFLKF